MVIDLEVSHNEPAGVQFSLSSEDAISAVLVTLRRDNPEYELHGSIALLTNDGIMVTEFHTNLNDIFEVHPTTPLED